MKKLGQTKSSGFLYLLSGLLIIFTIIFLGGTVFLVTKNKDLKKDNSELERRLKVSGDERLALFQEILKKDLEIKMLKEESQNMDEERMLLAGMLDRAEENLRKINDKLQMHDKEKAKLGEEMLVLRFEAEPTIKNASILIEKYLSENGGFIKFPEEGL